MVGNPQLVGAAPANFGQAEVEAAGRFGADVDRE